MSYTSARGLPPEATSPSLTRAGVPSMAAAALKVEAQVRNGSGESQRETDEKGEAVGYSSAGVTPGLLPPSMARIGLISRSCFQASADDDPVSLERSAAHLPATHCETFGVGVRRLVRTGTLCYGRA